MMFSSWGFRRIWKATGRELADSEAIPIQLGVHEVAGYRKQGELNRELDGNRFKFLFTSNYEDLLPLILCFRFAWIGKSSNGGGKLFDLQSSGSDGLHGHGFVLCRRSLCSYFDPSSTASSFSSSLHDSTVPVRLHFHRRLSPRLRSNPSCKLQLLFSGH